jgi:hypothetical protein
MTSNVRAKPDYIRSTAGHAIHADRLRHALGSTDGRRSSRDDWRSRWVDGARRYGEGGLRFHAGCAFDPSPVVNALAPAKAQRQNRSYLPYISDAASVSSSVRLRLTATPWSRIGVDCQSNDGQKKEVLNLHICGRLVRRRIVLISTPRDLAR